MEVRRVADVVPRLAELPREAGPFEEEGLRASQEGQDPLTIGPGEADPLIFVVAGGRNGGIMPWMKPAARNQ